MLNGLRSPENHFTWCSLVQVCHVPELSMILTVFQGGINFGTIEGAPW